MSSACRYWALGWTYRPADDDRELTLPDIPRAGLAATRCHAFSAPSALPPRPRAADFTRPDEQVQHGSIQLSAHNYWPKKLAWRCRLIRRCSAIQLVSPGAGTRSPFSVRQRFREQTGHDHRGSPFTRATSHAGSRASSGRRYPHRSHRRSRAYAFGEIDTPLFPLLSRLACPAPVPASRLTGTVPGGRPPTLRRLPWSGS